MTPESLQRINDLRLRVVQADQAERSGDFTQATLLRPSDEEIIEALKILRAERVASATRKADKVTDKARASAIRTMDVNALFD